MGVMQQPLESSPIVVDDVVFFGSDDRNIYALQATTGSLIKVLYTTEAMPCTSVPTVEKGVLYMEDTYDSFYAIE
jgi:eukaryotic-like serine/threonine-protein kinase